MSKALANNLTLPESLKRQLRAFRNRVWRTKLTELGAMASVGVVVAIISMFAIDRVIDTPDTVRWILFATILIVATLIPWGIYNWVWKNRHPEQLAKLLRRRDANMGDQLLGVIELTGKDSDSEVSRSPALCQAAIAQVASSASQRNLNDSTPATRYRAWALFAMAMLGGIAVLGFCLPVAFQNAIARTFSPWSDTPRYTFTSLEDLPDSIVVPHGEAFEFAATLENDSRWQPETADLTAPYIAPLTAKRTDRKFAFDVPPQVESTKMQLKVGDRFHSVAVEPKPRPEISSIQATIRLPDYLQIPEPVTADLRGGLLTAVAGSNAVIHATASRGLAQASMADRLVSVSGDSLSIDGIELNEGEFESSLNWKDTLGLDAQQPFRLLVRGTADEAPSVTTQELPRQAVLLNSEQLNFPVFAADDFGIKTVGMSWRGLDTDRTDVAEGDKILFSGAPTKAAEQIPGTFCASKLGIAPQPIEVRFWIEDYKSDRERSYSPPHLFYVLSPDQHAIWITEQLSKWHRQALNVRDRELQLFAKNKDFRQMGSEQLNAPDMRKELQNQANNERTNGRRLSNLTNNGRELIQQAARNAEIGVGHLDQWAEMLKTLDDIAANRMPTVADLLAQAGKAKPGSKSIAGGEPAASAEDGQPGESQAGESSDSKDKSGPQAGKNRNQMAGQGGAKVEKLPQKVALPSISDVESSQQPPGDAIASNEDEKPQKKNNGAKFSLPQTTLIGPAKKTKPNPDAPAGELTDAAVLAQEDLLAEFEKVADELNEVLANLEGSTLVKRLKAESRNQGEVADKLSQQIAATFGASTLQNDAAEVTSRIATDEAESASRVSNIMDDIEAYFERRRMAKFRLVLDDMRESKVISSIRQLGDDLAKEQGLSIAQAEYWSDTMDRWAEDLVDPASSGQCPGSKTVDALPPSLVLECLQILEAEVNLREETRVTEQAKAAVAVDVFEENASTLQADQHDLTNRVRTVVEKITDLEEGAERFGKEIDLLGQVASVMIDAEAILGQPNTAGPAIAAETEAIELLLQSKRINPGGGGGGGGSSPGGGGTGDTETSALALAGRGVNPNEQREPRDVAQTTGETKRALPEEFRSGLDEYFNRLDASMN
jgi:hypothetical protein